MGKVKDLVIEICEMYDEQGMTIREIAFQMEMTEDDILEVLSNYSDSFNVA